MTENHRGLEFRVYNGESLTAGQHGLEFRVLDSDSTPSRSIGVGHWRVRIVLRFFRKKSLRLYYSSGSDHRR